MAKRPGHEWGFVANTPKGDLVQCQYESCRKYQIGDGKPFKLSYDEFIGMHNRGEINAHETVGEITNQFLIKPKSHKGFKDITN